MNDLKNQKDRLNRNLQKMIDLINKQQNEIEKWKQKYDQLKEQNLQQKEINGLMGVV